MNALTREQIAAVKGKSSRQAAEILGVDKSTINRARVKYGLQEDRAITDPADDGTITIDDVAQTKEQADWLLEDYGIDREEYDVSYGFSRWDAADGSEKKSVRIKASPKPSSTLAEKADVDELIAAIAADLEPPLFTEQYAGTLVLAPADWQIGKTDYEGGTKETLERIRQSLSVVVERLAERGQPYENIVLAEMGDIVENFYNTSSQRETNDLDITSQIRVARRMMLEVIREVAPWCDNLYYVAVPSNHGSVRVGFKQQAATVDNDWGLEIQAQVMDALAENPTAYGHVKAVKPAKNEESVALDIFEDGDHVGVLGFVHGHQASNPDKIGQWWAGQSHGRRPTAMADILVTGHWHSLRVQHSGDARWIIVAPTSDPGSSWFTEKTGENSQSGMLSFELDGKNWKDLRIN